MQLHSNAATCPRQRQLIRNSPLPYRTLAQQLDISLATVHHWKHQQNPLDRSCRPAKIHYALDEQEEQMVLWMRRSGELPLDELLEAAQELLPSLRRSSLHRLLMRHGCSRLPQKQQQDSGQIGTFKEYGPGYLHVDCFYLPKLLPAQAFTCPSSKVRSITALWLRPRGVISATNFGPLRCSHLAHLGQT